jgi:hypothetical protein
MSSIQCGDSVLEGHGLRVLSHIFAGIGCCYWVGKWLRLWSRSELMAGVVLIEMIVRLVYG